MHTITIQNTVTNSKALKNITLAGFEPADAMPLSHAATRAKEKFSII
jgi:hypothetical protein